MKFSFVPRLIILLSFALLLILPTVSGAWSYFSDPALNDLSVSTGMGIFYFAPEEILPGDEEADEAQGNHLVLIMNIIRETDYNINDGSKRVIHEYLGDFGVVYGNYKATSGGTLSKVLTNQSPESANVQFMMVKKSDTEYHTYSFSQQDLNDAQNGDYALPDGYIEVYKTIMLYQENENGQMEWKAVGSHTGKAKTNTCQVGEKNKTVYSIVYETWIET